MKYILIIALLFSTAKAQLFTKNDLLVAGLQFIAGSADGVNQALTHHHWQQGKSKFWDADISWKNKYKDFDKGDMRPAFFGSKSILVAFTDGYHLTRFVDRTATLATIAVSTTELKNWKIVLKKIIISAISNRAAFYITYNNLHR